MRRDRFYRTDQGKRSQAALALAPLQASKVHSDPRRFAEFDKHNSIQPEERFQRLFGADFSTRSIFFQSNQLATDTRGLLQGCKARRTVFTVVVEPYAAAVLLDQRKREGVKTGR